MTNDDDALRDLLRRGVPLPAREPTLDQVKAAARQRPVLTAVSGRRSWIAPVLSAAAVLIVVSAVALLLGTRGDHHSPGETESTARTQSLPTSQPDSASESTTSSTSASGPPTQVRACAPSQLTASIGRRGSTASAPFLVVVVRNHGAIACTVTGYPEIMAFSGGTAEPSSVVHGTYEVPDAGPRQVTLSPHGAAFFAFGTSTAYSRPPITITSLKIGLPGATAGSLTLAIPSGIGATPPSAGRLQIAITAFAAGTGA